MVQFSFREQIDETVSFQFQDHIYFLYKWWQKKSKLLQKQIAHVSQDVVDPNLLYLHYG